MFKEMSEEYYALKIAEKKVHRALREKGLYLDQKDFNIMEVFNNVYSDCSYEEEREEVDKISQDCVSMRNLDISAPQAQPEYRDVEPVVKFEGLQTQ